MVAKLGCHSSEQYKIQHSTVLESVLQSLNGMLHAHGVCALGALVLKLLNLIGHSISKPSLNLKGNIE